MFCVCFSKQAAVRPRWTAMMLTYRSLIRQHQRNTSTYYGDRYSEYSSYAAVKCPPSPPPPPLPPSCPSLYHHLLGHWFEPTQGHVSSLFHLIVPCACLAQFSLNNVHKGGLKQHHLIFYPYTTALQPTIPTIHHWFILSSTPTPLFSLTICIKVPYHHFPNIWTPPPPPPSPTLTMIIYRPHIIETIPTYHLSPFDPLSALWSLSPIFSISHMLYCDKQIIIISEYTRQRV